MRLPLRWETAVAVLILLIGIVAIQPVLRGQDPPAAKPQPAAPANVENPADQPQPDGDGANKDESADAQAGSSILGMIVDSGITGMAFMAILGLFSIIAGTVAVERAINMRRSQILPLAALDEIESFVRHRDDPSRLERFCENCDAVVVTILRAALVRQGHPLAEVEKSMEDTAARELSELRARIRPLNTVGSIAPLVGLLGTVVGMIIAFHTASQAGLGKAELLAKGIYMALLTTAGGLSVAIPSLLLGSFFSGRIDRFFREMDRALMPILPALAGGSTRSNATASRFATGERPSRRPASRDLTDQAAAAESRNRPSPTRSRGDNANPLQGNTHDGNSRDGNSRDGRSHDGSSHDGEATPAAPPAEPGGEADERLAVGGKGQEDGPAEQKASSQLEPTAAPESSPPPTQSSSATATDAERQAVATGAVEATGTADVPAEWPPKSRPKSSSRTKSSRSRPNPLMQG